MLVLFFDVGFLSLLAQTDAHVQVFLHAQMLLKMILLEYGVCGIHENLSSPTPDSVQVRGCALDSGQVRRGLYDLEVFVAATSCPDTRVSSVKVCHAVQGMPAKSSPACRSR